MASSSLPEESQQHHQQQQQQLSEQPVKEDCVHKTKVIQFLGRNTPIVLQNENGPCPLLAISNKDYSIDEAVRMCAKLNSDNVVLPIDKCNVLLLRNNLNLGPDQAEISQESLLSLVAERLIDSNINVNNKDAGYVENQQQNIADAIDHLPRLATGIDVNIKFRRIDDFEFTPECAIFDLLDIPLYHGWIVDPQDPDTARAIDSKSYNALMEELVALETRNMKDKTNTNPEEDCIDFAAATTATLGVPSPSLSKTLSFEESPRSVSEKQGIRKGDLEEEAELLRILRISEGEVPATMGNDTICNSNGGTPFINFNEEASPLNVLEAINTKEIQIGVENDNTDQPETTTTNVFEPLSDIVPGQVVSSSASSDLVKHTDHFSVGYEKSDCCSNLVEKNYDQGIVEAEVLVASFGREGTLVDENYVDVSKAKQKDNISSDFVIDSHKPADEQRDLDAVKVNQLSVPGSVSDLSSSRMQPTDESVGLTSRIAADSEPIYEGEECILDRETTVFEDREPVYEGEVILAEQASKNTLDATTIDTKEEITPKRGDLISNFLKNSASQLTIFGLFCLQDGLKERELCVFFRNNHFSTLFKLDGQLYLLATDQGYINQPDLVWEKLNEVNGDTVFMTGNFKEFKVESNANESWNEHTAVASTADYLASIDPAAHSNPDMNSDLQLAIALQQQEFEQPPQPHNAPQPSVGSSRLITGPQVQRNSGRNQQQGSAYSASKPDGKSKDKCCVM